MRRAQGRFTRGPPPLDYLRSSRALVVRPSTLFCVGASRLQCTPPSKPLFFSTAGTATRHRRPRRRRTDEDGSAQHSDPWGNMEISEIRIVYDPKGASSSSISTNSRLDYEGASQRTGPSSSSSAYPYPRVSTANWPAPAPLSNASSAPSSPAPFPRPMFSSPITSQLPKSPPYGSDITSSEAAASSDAVKPMSWKMKLLFVGVMILQIWDIRRGMRAKEAKRKEEEPKQSTASTNDGPAATAITAAGSDQIVTPSDPAAAVEAASSSSSGVRKANSLELWVSQQKKLKRSRLIKHKLERGLNKNERDAVLLLCLQSVVEAKQAREILAGADDDSPIKKKGANVVAGGRGPRVEVSVRKVLVDRLGGEVQMRDYAVMKTTLHRSTTEANEWIQESQQILQSRTYPSRRVYMNIRTRIIETKEKPSKEAEEGLILVENGRDLLQEMLHLIAGPTSGQESDSRIATYVEKVDMTFGPSMCLEFEFDDIRIS